MNKLLLYVYIPNYLLNIKMIYSIKINKDVFVVLMNIYSFIILVDGSSSRSLDLKLLGSTLSFSYSLLTIYI